MLNEELERQVKIRTAKLEKELVQRKKAEERLIRQQEFSRALLESMADGVVACDAEGVLTLFNRTAKEWHGTDPMRLPPEEWAEHYDLFCADGITPLTTEEIPLARAFKGENFVDAGMAIVARGQAARFILANGSMIRDENGKNLGAVVVMRDVTELRRAEEALRKANDELESTVAARTSELETTLEHLKAGIEERKRVEETLEKERKRMEVLLSALNTGLSLINPDMTIAWVNPKIREMFPDREPVGQVCHVFYEARATICDGCGTVRAFMDGKVCESEQLVPATGRWYYIISQPIKDAAGRVVNVLEGITDITERKQAEDEVRHLKNYLANIIDSMPSILVGLDRNEIVTQWNRQAETATAISTASAIGRPLAQLLPDYTPWIEAMRGTVEQHHPASLEKLLIERNGERRFYDLMLYPLVTNGMEGTVLRIEDVTERTRIQELMIQTEKMMSVGGLAAGMAHEINNPLGIITQAAQNIERRVSPDHPANREAAREAGVSLETIYSYFEQRQIPEFIASIREAAARASRIIANILRFSRCTEMTMQRASLTGIMEQALELAANDYDLKKKYDFRSIEIVRDYQPDLPEVPVVATEIEQVLLNLLKNAAQAMIANPPQRKPGITLRIRQQERYAVLEVEDNGPGMTEDIRRRVFEPFFTTKEPGVGTGLGLSVSYMIVTQNHKGLMEVASLPGKGSKFSIKVPLAHGNDSEESCATNCAVDRNVC